MNQVALAKYSEVLSHLRRHVNKVRGGAPHKPLLLLAILHEIEQGNIRENRVAITPELVAAFYSYWQTLVPGINPRKDRIAYPFRYLRQDGFWELVKDGVAVVPDSDHVYTLTQLAELCDGGRFADDLWPLLAEPQTRAILRSHLLSVYFPIQGQASVSVDIAAQGAKDYLYSQYEKLKQEANAQFRMYPVVREKKSDGYFVRHHLFPKFITEIYDFSCCVCQLSARIGGNSMVDGAHIMPFGEFHNDHPRNGLALCKNHHWGFDYGAWSLTDDYKVLVSPRLQYQTVYVRADETITLPINVHHRPDPTALGWHRKKWKFE